MKINGKEISEFKDIEELVKNLKESLDSASDELQKDYDSTMHFLTGFSDMSNSGFEGCHAKLETYMFTLKTIDRLFGTDYSNLNKIYGTKKHKES